MLQEKTPRTNIRSTERIRIGYSSSLNRELRRNEGEDDCGNSTNKGENMKKIVLSIALAFVAPFAWGQVSETTTTTTTTDASGTITEYSPGGTIVLKETSGPRHYRFGKSVTYVTRSGKVLDEDVVDRVILDED